MSQVSIVRGLAGFGRQHAAISLWKAWQEEGRTAAVISGMPGVGKTERVVRPLMALAAERGIPAVIVDVPRYPTDLEKELLGHLVEAFREAKHDVIAERLEEAPSFAKGLRDVINDGALVVLDEFQRALDRRTALPLKSLADGLQRVAKGLPCKGCLWLVTSQELESEWTEPFHTAVVEAPSEPRDMETILFEALAVEDVSSRFPADRGTEVFQRLGGNPRAIRLLGRLLRHYALDDLLGPLGDVPISPVNECLTRGIERGLLEKAKEMLPAPVAAFLRDLTILRVAVPAPLVKAMAEPYGEAESLCRELRDRFLLEIHGSRYRVHPVVREVEGPRMYADHLGWRLANSRAGMWYARSLVDAAGRSADDSILAVLIAGARFHLTEAQDRGALRRAMRAARSYIAERYGWDARLPLDEQERDAQISLLSLFLEERGPTGVEFTLARRLRDRGAPGDLEAAIVHAHAATLGEKFADPWVLWVKLTREVAGLEEAAKAARHAAEVVSPGKALYEVYQLWAGCLVQLGRTAEAVDVLRHGADSSEGSTGRLVQEAVLFAAAEPDHDLLREVREWADHRLSFGPPVALADVLLLEREEEWERAAGVARDQRTKNDRYLPLALHEAICWLGAGEPARAAEALSSFPGAGGGAKARDAFSWLESLVALRNGKTEEASEALTTYLGSQAPVSAVSIEAVLLREWDHRVGTIGEPNPALLFPVLPGSVTGLEHAVRRRQYGAPVLPQHWTLDGQSEGRGERGLGILSVATEWASGHGGLSTLNRQLCVSLAKSGAQVVCLALDSQSAGEAANDGVALVSAVRTPGLPDVQALARRPKLPNGFAPDVVLGHGRVTGPFARVHVQDHFTNARQVHFVHMAPDEIEWFKLDRVDDAGVRAEERTEIELQLGQTADLVVAVGPRLYKRYLRDLSARPCRAPIRFDPGFDGGRNEVRVPPPGEPYCVLLLGRLEDKELKGLDIAARSVGLALEKLGDGVRLELVVRGAKAGASNALQAELREWSGNKKLLVTVRPYTVDAERLDADLRRASLVLMPSRSEGFGLVGVEAIVAGTPVLVSRESGLGELLTEALDSDQAKRLVLPMTQDLILDCEAWGSAVTESLRDRGGAFHRAAEVRARLGGRRTWAAAASGLIRELMAIC